ncbi:MAG: hypothetical protein ABEJ42_09505 [Halobacteriaceae archaeon]
MVTLVAALRLAAGALGTLGGTLVFVEFFQLPGYVRFEKQIGSYSVELSPEDPTEYTWIGRVGALLMATAFALLFLATTLSSGLA